ncbi:NAD(P)-dependent oxidoreductase [Streptomyces spinoverrucosus]|uniref:NAD-dependent epimerase/dehydratase family protein n=1 Tax=Streptomyces spinoverrucosus TaxID=284043 RepID=UPI0018C3639C|nr:NAD(P)-dependent oxidoreductase [Streptomyces spinoverrucosus]MBG0854655.1 NAD(P)-dependent oxidoreductase [Streptomyces spinoverrucosus]
MSPERILVTGGTGFIGSHVVPLLRTASAAPDGPALRLLTHHRPGPDATGGGLETAHGDLADPASLHGLCDGVTTVLHLASRIGGTPEECRTVNEEGTRALLAEAARAGVRRIVQLGTAAVYGDGPHRGEREGRITEAPVSPTSATRLAGERLVLAAGGTVVRPYLVYGEGDTWVVPGLARLLRRLPHWVNGADSRLSLISAPVLARALTELALAPHEPTPTAGRVLHAAHPEPVTLRELLTTVCGALDLPLPTGEITLDEALHRLDAHGPGARRPLALVTVDRWYDSSALWSLLSTDPGAPFMEAFKECAPWYRQALAGTR